MSTLTLTWPQVLLLVTGVLAIYGLEMAFFYWRLKRHDFAQHLAQLRLQQLEQKVQQLQQLLHPEPQSTPPLPIPTPMPAAAPLAAPQAPIPPLAVDEPDPEPSDHGASYNRAIDLARHGAMAAVLSRECGLSRGEADLIVSLYGAVRK